MSMLSPALTSDKHATIGDTIAPVAALSDRLPTEETVETLYLLGEQDRIVGVSGYAVRPPQVRREKPRVSQQSPVVPYEVANRKRRFGRSLKPMTARAGRALPVSPAAKVSGLTGPRSWRLSVPSPIQSRAQGKTLCRSGEAFAGTARFVRPDAVAIGDKVLVAKHILIATGAKPGSLPIAGAELLKTSDEFLQLDQLPDRILFVGGGYISFEFAHIAARAGAAGCNTT
jgi:pyridine nucleotide-disulfide oxidoreductase